MAASVANCNRIEKDDGIELWTSQIPLRERNKRPNLNNLYFAHRWLYHAVLKVVANDTFREVKTHTAQQRSKLNSNQRTGSRNKSHLEPFIEKELYEVSKIHLGVVALAKSLAC